MMADPETSFDDRIEYGKRLIAAGKAAVAPVSALLDQSTTTIRSITQDELGKAAMFDVPTMQRMRARLNYRRELAIVAVNVLHRIGDPSAVPSLKRLGDALRDVGDASNLSGAVAEAIEASGGSGSPPAPVAEPVPSPPPPRTAPPPATTKTPPAKPKIPPAAPQTRPAPPQITNAPTPVPVTISTSSPRGTWQGRTYTNPFFEGLTVQVPDGWTIQKQDTMLAISAPGLNGRREPLPVEFTAPETIFHAQFMQLSRETPGGGKTIIAFEAYTKVPYSDAGELAAENLKRDVRDMQLRRFRIGGLEDKGTIQVGGRQAGFQGLLGDGPSSIRSRSYYLPGATHFIKFVVMSSPAAAFAAGEHSFFGMVSFAPAPSRALVAATPPPAAPVENRVTPALPTSAPGRAPQTPEQQSPRAAASVPIRPVYSGPRAGVLVWTGQLVRGLEVSIYGRGDIRSSVTGDKFPEIGQPGRPLPVPIEVTVEGANLTTVERPSASDEYSRVVIRATRDQKRAQVRIHWRVREP
jgi:hypothetical protein